MAKTELTPEQKTELANLRILADSMGLDVHPRMKAETLQKMISDKEVQNYHEQQLVANKTKVIDETEVAIAEAKAIKLADERRLKSEDEIVGFLQSFINRGLMISFNGDNTWVMRYNKKEDSGHMTASRGNIVLSAEKLFSARSPTGYQNDEGKLVLSA